MAIQIPVAPEPLPFDLYELTGSPSLDTDWREYKAQAKPVEVISVTVDEDGHYVADAGPEDENPVSRYRRNDEADEETIWFPVGTRDTNEEPVDEPCVGHPGTREGDRVWTVVRDERREVVMPPRVIANSS